MHSKFSSKRNMEVLSLFLGLALILTANAAGWCPTEQEVNWEIEVLLPHEDCHKFYQCVHGLPIEMICPIGLYFNPKYSKCEWKINVDCTGRNVFEESNSNEIEDISTENSPESDGEESVEAKPDKEEESGKPKDPIIEFLPNGCPIDPEIHWLVPHERNCSLFYYCVWGERTLSGCPRWLFFNRKLQVCDWPRNVDCIVPFELADGV